MFGFKAWSAGNRVNSNLAYGGRRLEKNLLSATVTPFWAGEAFSASLDELAIRRAKNEGKN